MKKIYILCDHGLGNRLASLIGGLTIAKRFNFLPVICWPTNNWCYAEFTDLFDLNFDLADNNFSQSIVEQIQELGLHYFFISTFRDNCISTNRIGFDDIATTNEDIIYSQCKIPKGKITSEDISSALSSLKIRKKILKKVRSFCDVNEITAQTVGIHLRKSDSNHIINDDEIFEEIKNSPHRKYFICSECKETQNKFSQLANVCVNYKDTEVKKITDAEWRDSVIDKTGKTILYNIERPKEQIVDALIDMLLLSRTNISKRAKSTFLSGAQYYSRISL